MKVQSHVQSHVSETLKNRIVEEVIAKVSREVVLGRFVREDHRVLANVLGVPASLMHLVWEVYECKRVSAWTVVSPACFIIEALDALNSAPSRHTLWKVQFAFYVDVLTGFVPQDTPAEDREAIRPLINYMKDLVDEVQTRPGQFQDALNEVHEFVRIDTKPKVAQLAYQVAAAVNPDHTSRLISLTLPVVDLIPDRKKHVEALAGTLISLIAQG